MVNNDSLAQQIEQLAVQLAGCGVAALGGTSKESVAKRGTYGWSPSYEDVLGLRRKYDRLVSMLPPEKSHRGGLASVRYERFCRWLAWLLPEGVVAWAFSRVVAYACHGKYGNTVISELTAAEALRRWTV